MRKHIDYYYKCYDRQNESNIDKIVNERFNEYGYNFDTNSSFTVKITCLQFTKDYLFVCSETVSPVQP